MKIFQKTAQIIKPVFSKFSGNRYYSATAQALDPFQESELNQKLILVNEQDEIVGCDSKRKCHRVKNGQIPLHRAFSVFIFNSKNEILLQQRASCKVTYPDHVTNACCSHPLYDIHVYRDNLQTSKLAVQRRLMFELGIPMPEANPGEFQFVTKIHYFSKGDGTWGEHEVDYIFVLHKDLTIVPNPIEVKQVWSFPRKEFVDFIKNCEYPLTPWFDQIMKNGWLFKIWDNLADIKSIRDDKIHKYIC
ncbi:hypothetical protein PGB90_006598 [Kerria lacca]